MLATYVLYHPVLTCSSHWLFSHSNKLYRFLSRHMVVCRVAQEAGVPHRGCIDRKKENVIFTPLYLGDTLSDWNHICCRVARQLGESIVQI